MKRASRQAKRAGKQSKQASKRPPTRRGWNALHSCLCLQFTFRLPFYLLHITARERPRYSGAERRKRQRERGRNDGCCEPRRVLARWGPTPSPLADSLSSLALSFLRAFLQTPTRTKHRTNHTLNTH